MAEYVVTTDDGQKYRVVTEDESAPTPMTLPDLPKPKADMQYQGPLAQYEDMGRAILNRQPKPTPQAAGALGAMLSAGTGGAGPLATAAFGALAGKLTNSNNAGGMTASSAVDTLMNLHPATRAMNLAGRGAISGASYLAGQTAAGQTPTPGEAGAVMGASTVLPPVLKGLANAVISSPVANALVTKSKDVAARAMEALGLTVNPGVTEQLGQAAAGTRAELANAGSQYRQATEAAAEQGTKVRTLREQMFGVEDAQQQARQRVLAARDEANRLEKELMPIAQNEADAALAQKVTGSLNKAHQTLTTQGYSDADVKGIPFLLARKNPELAARLANNPTPETIQEAAEFYKMDRAQNVVRRILAGRHPDNYEQALDPEMARMGQSVLNNPAGVPAEVLERYKAQLNNLAPALFKKDFNSVIDYAKKALARDTAGKFNVNAPPSPEAKAMGTINKTFFGNLKPGTATPEMPAEVANQRNLLATLEGNLTQAQEATRATQGTLTQAQTTLGQRLEDKVKASNLFKQAKENLETLGLKPNGSDLNRLKDIAKDQPEVFFARMADGGAKAVADARAAVKLIPDQRNSLAGGAVQRLFEGAKDAQGRVMDIAPRWKKAEPVFRELLGDEGKVTQLGHFVEDLASTQKRLEQAGHGMHMLVGVGGVAAFLRYGASQPALAGAAATAGGGVWLAIKWPKLIDMALTNPALGKELVNYAGKAGTQGGLQLSRDLSAWLTANGTPVQQTVKQPAPK